MLEKEKAIRLEQAKQSGKPEAVIPKIVDGQIAKWTKEICLLDQVWVKDPEARRTSGRCCTELIAKIGENMRVRRFVRFELGEGSRSAPTTSPPRSRSRRARPETGRVHGQADGQTARTSAKAQGRGERVTGTGRNGAVVDRRRPPSKLPLAPGVKYRRILLKLSGEALMGRAVTASTSRRWPQIADELIDVHGLGVEIALVIGGGNIFRGVARRPAAWTARTPTTWACWRP